MAVILNIDTAIDKASLCVSSGNDVIYFAECLEQKAQASWLHVAIEEAMQRCGYSMTALDAVAVSNGPGSYTGLRIGLSTAKGLCYALGKPLLCINTLKVIASATLPVQAQYICPMIDARRMEVYTAVYDTSLDEIWAPQAVILTNNSYDTILTNDTVLFTGNGASKFIQLTTSPNAQFAETIVNATHLAPLAIEKLNKEDFSDLFYAEPEYVKNVHITF